MSDDITEFLSPHDEEHRTYILVTGANRFNGCPYPYAENIVLIASQWPRPRHMSAIDT